MKIDIRPEKLWIPKFDEVFYNVFDNKYTHTILPGGRGSTKSSKIGIDIVLGIVNNPSAHAAIFRKVGNTLKTSVYGQILWAIEQLGMGDLFISHVNPLEIIFTKTGQKILFFGLDDPGKIKSVKLPFGYIAITWFEELDQFSGEAEIRKVLQSTQRGGPKFWNYMSFNPPLSKNNWANAYTLDSELNRKDDTLVIRSSYLDVPKDWLGPAFIAEAEYVKEHQPRVYQNEYLGIAVGSGGNIFPNVSEMVMTDEIIGGFFNIFNGLDWGYANDPNAFVKMHYDARNRDLYIFAEHSRLGESNRVFFDTLYKDKTFNKRVVNSSGEITYEPRPLMESYELITADSAEPKSIGDFTDYGSLIRPVHKFPDSVRYGIKWLQSLNNIYIDKNRCPNAYTEFMSYEHERDKSGMLISSYPDKNNHCIDAVRYALSREWARRGK